MTLTERLVSEIEAIPSKLNCAILGMIVAHRRQLEAEQVITRRQKEERLRQDRLYRILNESMDD